MEYSKLCYRSRTEQTGGGPFTVLSPRYMPTPAVVLAGVPNWHMPPRSGEHACCLSSLMAWLVFGWRFGSNTVHRCCIASPSQHRQRNGKKEKKSEESELAQKAAQVIDSAEQRILALPATWAPPTTGHPGPSMPPPTAQMRSPAANRTRERETCLLPCPRSRPETPGSDAPTVTCQ